ncbi:hypothetical protein [Micromonospora arborensis]|uniref:hypothetical protein n=1 Tax=Micromonospora arborensis TaxID=2116518 RepID=UPI003715652F
MSTAVRRVATTPEPTLEPTPTAALLGVTAVGGYVWFAMRVVPAARRRTTIRESA